MALTDVGAELVAKAVIGEAYTPFSAVHAHLGIGVDTTAENVGQTDLLDSEAIRLSMEPGYPQRVGKVLTFRGLARGDEANFAWNEIGIFNAASGGEMLRRVVKSFGTKTAGQIWALQVQLEVRS